MTRRPTFRTHPVTMRTARERNDVTRGLEEMHGWKREEKGLPAPILERERTYTKSDITSEWHHQATVIAWWNKIGSRQFSLPTYALFSVPNGAALSGGAAGSANLQRAGMRSGIPDLILAVQRKGKPGLFCEMKREDGRLSEVQIEVQAWLLLQGYEVITCKGADPAIYEITRYLA